MYADCVLISHGQTTADMQLVAIKNQQHLNSLIETYNSPRFHKEVKTNPKYLNDSLVDNSHKHNLNLKFQLKELDIDIVLTPPHRPALETCLDLFADKEGVDIYIEPLLQPRVNCAANIPVGNLEEILAKFRKEPFKDKIDQNPNWFMELAPGGTPSEAMSSSQQVCLSQIQQNGDYETNNLFLQRNLRLRQQLFNYVRRSKQRIALVSHPQVLETLTATGWHEDGKLINNIQFDFGQIKREFIWIEGVEAEAEEKGLPLCG